MTSTLKTANKMARTPPQAVVGINKHGLYGAVPPQLSGQIYTTNNTGQFLTTGSNGTSWANSASETSWRTRQRGDGHHQAQRCGHAKAVSRHSWPSVTRSA